MRSSKFHIPKIAQFVKLCNIQPEHTNYRHKKWHAYEVGAKIFCLAPTPWNVTANPTQRLNNFAQFYPPTFC